MAAMIRLKLEDPGVCDPRIYTLRQSRPATRFWHLVGYVIRLLSCGIRLPITAIRVYSPPFSQLVWGHLSKVGKINLVLGISLLARYMQESFEDRRNYIEMEKSSVLGSS